jgi:hypothetical protein
MKYTLANGKTISIPDSEVQNIAKGLGLSIPEAVQVWLEDAEFEINEEQERLCKLAKENKVGAKADKKPRKPVERKPKENPIKEQIIKEIYQILAKNSNYCQILVTNPTKTIDFSIENRNFTINLIEHRQKK